MTRAGRNDRCPCGSGKKYKKCCLPEHQRRERVAKLAEQRPVERNQPEVSACPGCGHVAEHLNVGVVPAGVDADALAELCNETITLMEQDNLAEALARCGRLLHEYPDVHDGLELSAVVHEALGNHSRAADFWQQLLDFAEHPSRRRYYDQQVIAEWTLDRDRSRRLAAEAQLAQAAEEERAP